VPKIAAHLFMQQLCGYCAPTIGQISPATRANQAVVTAYI